MTSPYAPWRAGQLLWQNLHPGVCMFVERPSPSSSSSSSSSPFSSESNQYMNSDLCDEDGSCEQASFVLEPDLPYWVFVLVGLGVVVFSVAVAGVVGSLRRRRERGGGEGEGEGYSGKVYVGGGGSLVGYSDVKREEGAEERTNGQVEVDNKQRD
ncbi:hypothetical protein B0A55_03287 [Friedmanniomyces simplex]|uniref:Uncharacterized protein n=1 Tax=Friedmanniomyces simplex TaxID=329884 RepID=A0A4U0XXC3_9PEZI|nr:hypothetical protein B0A55_03287 [Friedmanniomyces simplex]